MYVITGSTAGKHLFSDWREPKDLDTLASEPSGLEAADEFVHPDIAKYSWANPDGVVTLDELYTIKVSHSFWSLKNGSWKKHMFDIVNLQRKGANFIPELHEILYPLWVEKHGAKKANLELEPDQFFNAHVDRLYDHDSIHASVAYYPEEGPLFNRILRDNHAVAVDRSKFENLTLEDKFKLVREEVYATSLERRIIPVDYKLNPRVGYDYALMKTITSYTKGWFPLFIVLHFDELRSPDVDYVAIHKNNSDKLIVL